MRFFSSSAFAKAPKLRFAASCSAAETMFRLSPAAPQADTPRLGLSADAGHYLVLGFDKVHWSIVRIARPRAGDDADVTPPRLLPSWPGPRSSRCRRPFRPPR